MEKTSITIERAKKLYEIYGSLLLENQTFSILLDKYKRAIDATFRIMIDLGIVSQCYRCGRTHKGSCCAPEVAEWYDAETLFVNLLMGCSLQTQSAYEGHCCFLGPDGCTLLARHSFCVNFLCDQIKSRLSQSDLAMFYRIAGVEITISSEIMSYFLLWRKRVDGAIVA